MQSFAAELCAMGAMATIVVVVVIVIVIAIVVPHLCADSISLFLLCYSFTPHAPTWTRNLDTMHNFVRPPKV